METSHCSELGLSNGDRVTVHFTSGGDIGGIFLGGTDKTFMIMECSHDEPDWKALICLEHVHMIVKVKPEAFHKHWRPQSFENNDKSEGYRIVTMRKGRPVKET